MYIVGRIVDDFSFSMGRDGMAAVYLDKEKAFHKLEAMNGVTMTMTTDGVAGETKCLGADFAVYKMIPATITRMYPSVNDA